jgi:hypothetical protein
MLMAGMFACVGMAQSKPDMSGTWNLNVSKSDFGQVPGPDSETLVITQDGANVKEKVNYADDQGKANYDLVYTTDGTEVVYPADSAPHIGIVTLQKLKANWQDSSLVLSETLKYQEDGDVTAKITRSLSPDAKVLTMDFDLMTPMGAMARKYIFERAGTSTSMAAPAPAASAAPMASMSSGPKPNLSGTWKLNVSKSDFGPVPPPDSRTDTIVDTEPSITITSVRTGGMAAGTITQQLTTDGKETTWNAMGNDAKSIANWDGAALKVGTKTTMQGQDVQFANVYTLSADGKTLLETSHVNSAMGEIDMKMVFDKQ